MRLAQVVDRVCSRDVDQQTDDQDEEELIKNAADLRVVVKRDRRRMPQVVSRHSPPPRAPRASYRLFRVQLPGHLKRRPGKARWNVSGSAGRTGSRLYPTGGSKPRWILSGEPCPTLRSNISP